jgi:hypothetical protein
MEPCWICLDECNEEKKCKCMKGICHMQCLAKWQMRNCGKAEETTCPFCFAELPDWKQNIVPSYEALLHKMVPMKIRLPRCQLYMEIPGSATQEEMRYILFATLGKSGCRLKSIYFTVRDPFSSGVIVFEGFAATSAVLYCAYNNIKTPKDKTKNYGLWSCFGL